MSENWFYRLTGFNEPSDGMVADRLEVDGSYLRSKVNGRECFIGRFEMASLTHLRAQVGEEPETRRRTTFSIITGDVRQMHQLPEYERAMFQVASQFNALEMVGPHVSPEQGVTRYENDHTQGPACAIAAGAATIYRNYFVPVGQQVGQSATCQLDGLNDIGGELSRALGCEITELWRMQNGYALATRWGLEKISTHLRDIGDVAVEELSGRLKVGLHQDVEVTDGRSIPGQRVSQIFCSALPVAYSQVSKAHWENFAQLVLDAAYEATLLAGVLNRRQGGSNIVLLTQLGGGAFGNDPAWIQTAILRALRRCQFHDLDVRLVSYGPPTRQLQEMLKMS